MSFVHFDQATFLAARAQTAQQMGPAALPEQVALPGAKVAIAHDRLLAHQNEGRPAHEIVAYENRRWREQHADRLDEHDRWVQGSYASAIQHMREAKMREQAEQLRRQAIFEQLIAEHEDPN